MDACGTERKAGEELQEAANSIQAGNRRIRLESTIQIPVERRGFFFGGRRKKGKVIVIFFF